MHNKSEVDKKLFALLTQYCSAKKHSRENTYYYLTELLYVGKIGNHDCFCVGFNESSDGGLCFSMVYDEFTDKGFKCFKKFGYVTDENITNNDYETSDYIDGNFSKPFHLNLEMVPNYKQLIFDTANKEDVKKAILEYTKIKLAYSEVRFACDKENRTYTLPELKIYHLQNYLYYKYTFSDLKDFHEKHWLKYKDMTEEQWLEQKKVDKKHNAFMADLLAEILEEQKDK